MPSTATQVSVSLAACLGLSSAFSPPCGVALRVATPANGARRYGVVSLRAATETIRRRGSSSERPRGDESLLRDLHTTTLKRAFAAPASDKKPLSKSGHPYETGAFGEIDYDAPSAKLKVAGRLSANQPPPAVHSVFDNEIDYDAPMSRQIAARGYEGVGDFFIPGRGHFKFETGAFGEIDYDAPSAKLKAAGRLNVNQSPPAVHSVFDNEIDTDAPMSRQIAARGYEGMGCFKFETGAFGEIDYDAPSAKLKAAGCLNVNQSPPAVHTVFDNEMDIDAPMSRQIAARGFEGRGHFKFETGAFGEIDYDAPSAKLKAARRRNVNQPPPAVYTIFDHEIDYDAPIVRQISARGYEGVGDFFIPGRGHFKVETGAFGEIGTNSQKASEWLYIVNLYISEHTRALTLRIINDLHQTTTPRLPSSRLPGA